MAEGCCQQFMIRSANVSDIPQIDALDPFAGDRAREIAEHRLFVIEKANAIVGYVSWQRAALLAGITSHFCLCGRITVDVV